MPRSKVSHSLGLVLREIRLRAGLSQEQLADKAGLDRTYIGRIETGKQSPTVETLEKLACALGLRLSEVLRLCEERQAGGHPLPSSGRTPGEERG